uniref:Uncharacterized protein n=1 Tax=Trichogramma kaykai TaxID=54128 RepID=A0ABD2VZ85_9HYME
MKGHTYASPTKNNSARACAEARFRRERCTVRTTSPYRALNYARDLFTVTVLRKSLAHTSFAHPLGPKQHLYLERMRDLQHWALTSSSPILLLCYACSAYSKSRGQHVQLLTSERSYISLSPSANLALGVEAPFTSMFTSSSTTHIRYVLYIICVHVRTNIACVHIISSSIIRRACERYISRLPCTPQIRSTIIKGIL